MSIFFPEVSEVFACIMPQRLLALWLFYSPHSEALVYKKEVDKHG
jgi:hypothetical protein